MNFAERRKQVFEKMERQSALILFSGIESHVSADEYAPFEADRNFFYLTGLRRDHMILLMKKTLKEEQVILFIEEADPTQERWYGRKVTVDEAKEISGIDNVMFLDSFEGAVDRMMAREDIDSLYFDCYRYQFGHAGLQYDQSKRICGKISGTCSEKYFAGDRRTAYAKRRG